MKNKVEKTRFLNDNVIIEKENNSNYNSYNNNNNNFNNKNGNN
jgi:hypothetical protein